MGENFLNINGIRISDTEYPELIREINNSIESNSQFTIAYSNAQSINLSFRYPELVNALNKFDIIHPDGIGMRFAASILGEPFKSSEKFTGSDLYPLLINDSIKKDHSFCFFGHDTGTLDRIPEVNPQIKITGLISGYDYIDEEVISEINKVPADILVIGLGTPKQELWTAANRHKLKNKVIICVGEGIKVFAGNKKRGPVFLRTLGLEWLWRFFTNPFKYFGRYIIGNPLFLYRIISIKMRKLAE